MRIIQAGIGGHGRTWLTVLQRVAETEGVVEVSAVVDPSAWARAVALEDGIPATRIFTALDEALRFVEADAVLVVTPPATHREVATLALEAGKHVLIEKPLAATVADARFLADLAREQKRTLLVSQNYRYQPAVRTLQRLLRSGEYGRPVAIEIAFFKDSRRYWPEENFRYAMEHPLLVDMSIHHLDMLRAIAGLDATAIDVASWKVPDSPYQGDVALTAIIRLAGAIPVTYRGNWASTGAQTTWNGDWQILTDRGRLVWHGWMGDDLQDQVTWEPNGGTRERMPVGFVDGVDVPDTLHAFLHAVATGSEPETGANDNLHTLEMLFAGVESATMHASVTIGDA